MGKLIMELHDWLAGLDERETPMSVLSGAAALIREECNADLATIFTLIPETNGVPCRPPQHLGEFHHPQQSREIAASASTDGMLGDLIRRGRVVIEEDAFSWLRLEKLPPDASGLGQFMDLEGILAFLYLPVSFQDEKLAALLFYFRQPDGNLAGLARPIGACATLLGSHLRARDTRLAPPSRVSRRSAIAHSRLGHLTLEFRGQLGRLDHEISQALAGDIPAGVSQQLEDIRGTISTAMRKLVISAADDMLLDLHQMTLAKALNTVVSELERGWYQGKKVIIDLPLVPAAIERLPFRLREILYALVLELLGNAMLHGGPPPYISVDINMVGDTVYLSVIDHGSGFDPRVEPFSEHGLGFWQRYVSGYLGGYFSVSSQPGFGAAVNVRIPVLL